MKRFLRVVFGAAALLGMTSAGAAQAQALGQPKVAVYNFKDENGTELATELRDMITTAIINSGKFNVFSRDFASAEEEAQLNRSGKTGRSASNSKVKAEPVDYSIEGSITSAQAGQENDNTGKRIGDTIFGKGNNPFVGCAKQFVSISLDVQIKQVGTQQTPYGESLTRRVQTKCNASGTVVDLPAALREMADELALKFATKIYPIRVIEIQSDGSLVFNYGESVLPNGTFLQLTSPGREKLVDGKMVTMAGVPLGRVQITNANPETARGVIEGQAGQIEVDAIATIDPNQEPARRRGRR